MAKMITPGTGIAAGTPAIDADSFFYTKGHDLSASTNPMRLEEHTIVWINKANPFVRVSWNYATKSNRDADLTAIATAINA